MGQFDLDQFSSQLQQTARVLLKDASPDQPLGDVARAIHEMAEVALVKHLIAPEKIACYAGCGHCCIVNVAVLAPETDAILDYLSRRSTRNELRLLALRAEDLYHQIHGLDDEERLLARRACLFLDESGCCRIYPVRPLLCRALTSTDEKRCQDAIALVALGEESPILANMFQQELLNRAFIGLGTALEQAGLDGRSQPLTAAIRSRLAGFH
jgi:Fe-S-cluster containining protein